MFRKQQSKQLKVLVKPRFEKERFKKDPKICIRKYKRKQQLNVILFYMVNCFIVYF